MQQRVALRPKRLSEVVGAGALDARETRRKYAQKYESHTSLRRASPVSFGRCQLLPDEEMHYKALHLFEIVIHSNALQSFNRFQKFVSPSRQGVT